MINYTMKIIIIFGIMTIFIEDIFFKEKTKKIEHRNEKI